MRTNPPLVVYSAEPALRYRSMVAALAAALLVLALATVTVSLLPFSTVKTVVDAMDQDGKADRFTAERFAAIARATRFVSVITLVALVGVCRMRRRIAEWMAAMAADAAALLAEGSIAIRTLPQREGAIHVLLILATIATGIVLRGMYLNQPMRYDEAETYLSFASRPIYLVLSVYTSPNNHLLHSVFVHAATSVFGNDPWAIRLPAFVAGVLLIPLVYFAARAYFTSAAALIAAAIVACNSALIEYSTNARGYSMMTLFFVIALLATKRIAETGERRYWVLFAVCAIAGLFTIPTMLYGIVFCLLWLALETAVRPAAPRMEMVKTTVATGVAIALTTAILYAPAVIASGPRAIVANRFVTAKQGFLPKLIDSFPEVLAHWNEGWPTALTAGLGVGFAIALIRYRSIAAHRIPIVIPVLGCVLVAILQRVVPFIRVWLFLAPVYLMIAAAGIAALMQMLIRPAGGFRAASMTAAMILCVIGSAGILRTESPYYSEQTGTARDAEQVASFLATQLHAGDLVISQMEYQPPLEYYFWKRRLPLAYFKVPSSGTTRVFAVMSPWNTSDAESDSDGRRRWQIILTKANIAARDGEQRQIAWQSRWGVVYQLPGQLVASLR